MAFSWFVSAGHGVSCVCDSSSWSGWTVPRRQSCVPPPAPGVLLNLQAPVGAALPCDSLMCHCCVALHSSLRLCCGVGAFTGPLPPGTFFRLDDRDDLLMTLPGMSEDTGFQHCVLISLDGSTFRYERASRGGLLTPKNLVCGPLPRGVSILAFELLDTPPIPFSPNRKPRRPPRLSSSGLYPGFLPLDDLKLRVCILPPPVRLADALGGGRIHTRTSNDG